MKIQQISFFKSIATTPKYNMLSPLKCDTITFSGDKRSENYKFSPAQKESEVQKIISAINDVFAQGEDVDEERISEITGLDITLVKLRFLTNKQIKTVYNKLKLQRALQKRAEREEKLALANAFFEEIKALNVKLTQNEASFFLGFQSGELFELSKSNPAFDSLYKDIIIAPKKFSMVEMKKQKTNINSAIRSLNTGCSYADIAHETGYNVDTIRAVLDRENKIFDSALDKKIYPDEIYPEEIIEKQDDKILDCMIQALKNNERLDLKEISKRTSLGQGIVQIRMKQNTALRETFKRMHGIYEDE